MKKLSVSLVTLGSLKYPVDIAYLEAWKSKLITIKHGASVAHLPDADGDNWERSKDQLRTLLKADPEADFTVGLINAPLEDNFYLRRLGDKVAVLSLFEMAEIVRYENFSIENFILRNIYELAVLYAANSALMPPDMYTWAHDDIRGCLFDMNANKADIVFSMHEPNLCDACVTRVKAKQVSAGFIPTLTKELKTIRKARYFRWTNWIQTHPLWALLLTGCTAIALNLVASIIFEKAKQFLPWIG